MNLKGILTPILKILGRAAVDTATRHAGRMLGGTADRHAPGTAKAQSRQARALVKKARQAARLTRRRG